MQDQLANSLYLFMLFGLATSNVINYLLNPQYVITRNPPIKGIRMKNLHKESYATMLHSWSFMADCYNTQDVTQTGDKL